VVCYFGFVKSTGTSSSSSDDRLRLGAFGSFGGASCSDIAADGRPNASSIELFCCFLLFACFWIGCGNVHLGLGIRTNRLAPVLKYRRGFDGVGELVADHVDFFSFTRMASKTRGGANRSFTGMACEEEAWQCGR
jgi:hypothetical protein